MQEMNRLMLAGTVISKDKTEVELETSELSFDGSEEYSHFHPVKMSEKNLKAVKKGMKIKVLGKFVNDDKRRGAIEATSVTPNYIGSDVNKGELIGKAYRSFQFFPTTADGKQAFGNVVVMLEDGVMIRGVCFTPTCHRFNRDCTTGSLVQVLGRIQHRPYTDRLGNEVRAIEIVGDDDFTNVLESVELVNPFEADEKIAEAI